MKLMYGNVPVKSMNVHSYELSTNDCTAIPSDLQSGVTCVSKGKKIIGTGKSFEFACYGNAITNRSQYIPTSINIIEISSLEYPIKLTVGLNDMRNMDFSTEQTIANVVIDGKEYNITVQALNNFLTISCEQTVNLQVFYGKDNYV